MAALLLPDFQARSQFTVLARVLMVPKVAMAAAT